MSQITPHGKTAAVNFIMLLFAASVNAQPAVSIATGTDIQKTVNGYPAGTTYSIKAGIHRLQQITPKDHDIFIGESGAVLNGSELLNRWVKEGIYWTHVIDLYKAGQQYDACNPGFEACKFPEDLFKNDSPMIRVITQDKLSKGHWYLDYSLRKVFVAEDPASFKMEISLARRAFGGNAKQVTVRGLIVEKYAIPGHMAAIGDQYPGDAWTIEGNEVRLNHGQGISFSGRALIRNNKVHHNGQLGIRSSKAKHAVVEGNELYKNTTPEIGYTWTHEGGGAKFTVSDSLIIRNNNAHDNWGPGLWTDIDNTNTLYESNTCTNNLASGIFHEISFSAIIRSNNLAGNGKVHGAQILISTSSDVDIYCNTIVVSKNSGDGIRLVQRDRGKAYSATNNSVHHNEITYTIAGKTSGAWGDFDMGNFWGIGNNRFENNRYHFPGVAGSEAQEHWEWNGQKLNWKNFQLAGNDAHGSVDQLTPSTPACK